MRDSILDRLSPKTLYRLGAIVLAIGLLMAAGRASFAASAQHAEGRISGMKVTSFDGAGARGNSHVNTATVQFRDAEGREHSVSMRVEDGRYVGDALACVVFIKSDLVEASAAFAVAGEDRADLDQLLPLDYAAVYRIENIRLLILHCLLDRHDAVHVAARQRGVVDLAPLGGGEAAFDQTDVAADDGGHMLAGLQ